MIYKKIIKHPWCEYTDLQCAYCNRGFNVDTTNLEEGVYNDICLCCNNKLKIAITEYPNGTRFSHMLSFATPLEQENANNLVMKKLV